jgi:hypothetical protein
MQAQADPAAGRREVVAIGAVLALATLAALSPVLSAPFAPIDDALYVTENPAVLSGLSPAGAAWAFTTFHAANWHPLTWLSHMLDVSLFGPSPAGPHAVNVLLHVANALLLFRFLLFATGRRWESAAVAALFALHPAHVEPVAWIAQRKELLCAFFFLLALSSTARRAQAGAGPGWPVAGGFALALLSKPMAVTLPFVLLLLDGWPLRREAVPLRTRIAEKVPLFAMAAAASVATVLAQVEGKGLTLTLREFTLRQRIETSAMGVVAYLREAAWPSGLAVYYPLPAEPFPPALAWGAVAAIVAVSLLGWRGRKSVPWFATGWFWFLGMLVPVVGLVRVGKQFTADRYTYLPYVGLSVVAVWAAAALLRHLALPRRAVAALALAPIAALAVATHAQAGAWRTSESLLSAALRATGPNPFVEYLMGRELAGQGRVEEAIAHLRNALRHAPDSPDAYNDLGIGLSMAGRFAEAEGYYREAIRRAPDAPNGYNNLARDYLRQGRADEAVPLLEECLRRNPGNPAAAGLLSEIGAGAR